MSNGEDVFRDDTTRELYTRITRLIEANAMTFRHQSRNTLTTSEREALEAKVAGLDLALKCVRYGFGLTSISALAAN